ncbi:DUF2157 domain-containing protein [Mesobacillus maritimus]|uniref:DUF2157 domain-containing protein n=1 Tax=Mesobacillus maritimus TaxID=1643336 RepID=UPI00384E9638
METNREEQRRIFRNELFTLKQLEYLSPKEVDRVISAHNQYSLDLLKAEEESRKSVAEPLEKIAKKKAVSLKKRPEKKKLSKEEIRERNISWLLNLGVILLLIGGLFVATSNWANMSDFMKVGSIGIVSLLFYGIAWIAIRLLKIEKTAFAFIVLGSLFIPIFILSLGWFKLLGEYLSFEGEGKYLLGVIGSLIVCPIYAFIARRLSSRLFVWFALVTLTAGAGFLLKSVGFEIDAFYLGIMVYNAGLAIGFRYLKKRDIHPLFTKELAPFVQVNLVLSTLLLVFFFENQVFNGFNLLLTACIYLAMIYVSRRKEYHFVFSIMLVYGAFQILENCPFEAINPLGFAAIGILFLFVPRLVHDEFGLQKVFRWTSALVSFLAFLYISVEGMLLRANEPSLTLLLAYVVIAGNFLYLANIENTRLFRYLSPVFLATALFEGVRILDQWLEFSTFSLPVFFIGLILFLIGWTVQHKWLQVINQGMRDVGFAIMLIPIMAGSLLSQWWELGFMLLLLALVFYVMLKIDQRKPVRLSVPWLIPISMGFAFVCFGEELLQTSFFYSMELGVPFHFAAAGIMVLITAWLFHKLKMNNLATSSFFSGEGFYTLALLYSVTLPMDDMIVRPILWLVGIFLYYLLYRFTNFKWVRFVVAGITLAFYFMIQIPLHEQLLFTKTMESFVLEGGGVLVLLIAMLLVKKDRELAHGFAWIGHVYLIPALLLTYFAFGSDTTWPMLIAVAIYAISIRFVQIEWTIKFLLYAAFTALFLTMNAGLHLFVGGNLSHYAFLTTSILGGFYWLFTNNQFKKRTYYYLVPFSLLGLMDFLSVYPFSWTHYFVFLGYATGLLALLHRGNWGNIAILPLFLVFTGTMNSIYGADADVWRAILLLAGIGTILLLIGRVVYQRLWEPGEKWTDIKVDGYTFAAFFFFSALYFFQSETFWAGIVHGILISLALSIQRHRVSSKIRFAFTFLAGAYLLVPYYTMLNELEIHPLWEREALVLPWIVLVIFLQIILKGRWKQTTNYIQWAVLLIVSLLLVQDGLASSTIYDALILGSLSLIAMLAGMWLRVKAFFFVGSGVLLLNVFLQTRPFWGNLPWWGYLLIVGTLLITVASFNEWNKQKAAKGEKTFIVKIGEKILEKLKQWN